MTDLPDKISAEAGPVPARDEVAPVDGSASVTTATIEPEEAPAPQVARVAFSELGPGTAPAEPMQVRMLSDIPLNVTVELGRATIKVRDLLALREGSVIELDKAPGTLVDIIVNGKLVARGDVVVVDDDFGVRVTEVIEPGNGF